MHALLLAAGLGTRLKPLTNVVPKCLVPINGKPLLEYWLIALQNAGVDSILVNLHYFPEMVKDFINGSPFQPVTTLVHEQYLLGTGGTLLHNRKFWNDDPVMLIHADNLCLCDLNSFVMAHQNRPTGTEITMMTFTAHTPESCGIVKLDESGVIMEYFEKVKKPPGDLANAAVYILEPTVMDYMESLNKSEIDFSTEVLPHFVGRIYTWHNRDYHRDIGTLESYAMAQVECRDWLKKNQDV